jgi:hypothetical protein
MHHSLGCCNPFMDLSIMAFTATPCTYTRASSAVVPTLQCLCCTITSPFT